MTGGMFTSLSDNVCETTQHWKRGWVWMMNWKRCGRMQSLTIF